ncbi:MAG: CPBP family intramembrane metalloprotease, partial [Thermanaerothrix sp.]|nr:CPBP family intramembrane metalloprotease [Thermanaerothrix sp.]
VWLQPGSPRGIVGVLILAYGLPWLLYLGMLFTSARTAVGTLPWPTQMIMLGQPWLYVWQVLALFLALPLPRADRLIRQGWASFCRHGMGFLLGMGLGGIAALAYALLLAGFESRWPEASVLIPNLPPLFLSLWLGVGVILAPWVEEYFFRAVLLDAVAVRWGRPRAVVLSAALFALGQGRPLLFLPAFGLGLALGGLCLRRGTWHAAAWAHMGINLALGGLAWYLLI